MPAQKHSAARVIIPVALTAFFLFLARWFLGLPLGNDDSLYMGYALKMPLSGFVEGHDWGTLYVFWFKLLGFFCHDPVARYFVSWGLIVTAIALVPTLFRRPAAWLYTLIILSLPLLIEGPFVGQFASAMVLIGFCWLLCQRLSFAETLCAACVLSFCVKFVRPEYNYGILLCAAATVVAVIVEWLRARPAGAVQTADASGVSASAPPSSVPAWILLLTVLSISAILIYLLRKYPSYRSGMAFAQHYNVRATIRGLIPPNPSNWRSNYAELRFGVDTDKNALTGTASIGQFIRANPRLFLAHVFYNLMDVRSLGLFALTLGVTVMPWVRKDLAGLRPASLFILLLSLPPLAGFVVIFPALNYASIVAPSLILFGLQVLNLERWLRPSIPWVLVPGFALLACIYLLMPYAPIEYEHGDLARVQCVRQWDGATSKADPNVFSAVDIPPVYLDPTRTPAFSSTISTWDQFQGWTAQTRPAWIAVDAPGHSVFGDHSLSARYGVTPQQLDAFLQKGLGYTPHPCSAIAELTVYTPGKR